MKKENRIIGKLFSQFIQTILIAVTYTLFFSLLYGFRHDLNDLLTYPYINYLPKIYAVIQHSAVLFGALILGILCYSVTALKKQYTNQCFSKVRVVLLVISISAILLKRDLHWIYVHHGSIYLDHVLCGILLMSLLVELSKRNFRIRCWMMVLQDSVLHYFSSLCSLKFDDNENSVMEKASTSIAISSNKEEMIDIGWDEYINHLIGRLRQIDVSGESYAVGFTNPWGAGKTTFLKSIQERLNEEKFSKVIFFDPWNSKNKEGVVRDFFNSLIIHLSPYYKKFDVVLTRYSNLLLEPNLNTFVNKLTSVFQRSQSDSLSSTKIEIEQILAQLNYTIYIIIDDLDRLDKDELFEVMKLIRNSASFKHIIYLVAYDKKYVVETLKLRGIESPYEYIQKIFPMELALPNFEKPLLLDYLYQELLRLNNNIAIEIDNSSLIISPA